MYLIFVYICYDKLITTESDFDVHVSQHINTHPRDNARFHLVHTYSTYGDELTVLSRIEKKLQ